MTASLPPPDQSGATWPAGWYPDPVGVAHWRWWDGRAWTVHAAGGPASVPPQRKPRLPRWLSPPVLVGMILVALIVIGISATSPWSVVAGLVPLMVVLPALAWLDRVEPEPWSSRIHAILWGAGIAVIVAGVINTIVGVAVGEVAATVISAPLVEEAAKGLGVYWAVRRRELDGVIDGVVYAGWVALGFAVVEDMTYFAMADVEGAMLPVFILRALLTPFAHPLFTFWIGLAVGRAVHRNQSVWPRALWGYALAVLTHFAWNGSLTLAGAVADVDEDISATVILLAFGVFVVLFVAVAVVLIRMRRSEQRDFIAAIPGLALRHQLGPHELERFAGWPQMFSIRKQLPRAQRRSFDRVHAALARLVLLDQRPGTSDPAVEQIYVDQLAEALDKFRSG
jgi:RsiW-degrading membrane proteinase PrsW (M82 family)